MTKRGRAARRLAPEDEVLVILGLVMGVGILLGVIWVLFNLLVDVTVAVILGAAGYVVWRARRRR
jgi:hypothetical protein